jgi:hypothetical protein
MFARRSLDRLRHLVAILPMLLAACGGGDAHPPQQTLAAPPDTAELPPPGTEETPPPDTDTATPPPDTTLADPVTDVSTGPDGNVIVESLRLASTYTDLIKGTINALPSWPVWYGTGKPVDGVNCLVNGTYHKHALISIYSNGKRLGFPDGIGRVHAGCYHAYEMHVHDVTGIIHMETDVPKTFTLGQWFSLWKQPLSRDGVAGLVGPVRYYIIEKDVLTRYDGNPYDIVMVPHREVLIVTGTPLTVVPRYKWPLGI